MRWKLATLALAIALIVSLVSQIRRPQRSRSSPRTPGRCPAPVRLPAVASTDLLEAPLAALAAAQTTDEVSRAIDRLGAIAAGTADARAVDAIAPFVDDPRSDLSYTARDALGSIGGDDASSLLIVLAHEGYPRCAVDALGHARTPEARATLEELARSGGDRGEAAIRALGHTRDDEVVTFFRGLLETRGPVAIAGDVAPALAEIATPAAGALLDELVASPVPAVRVAAIRAGAGGRQALLRLLSSPEEDELEAAADALADEGAIEAIPLVAAAIRAHPALAGRLCETLSELGRPAESTLVALLQAGGDVSLPAAQALGRIGDPTARAALVEAVRSGRHGAREAAMNEIADLDDPEVARFMIERGEAGTDVDQVLEYLTKHPVPEAIDLADRWLASGAPRRVQSAVELLARLDTAAARDRLRDLARRGAPADIRTRAGVALAALVPDDPETVDWMIAGISADDPRTALAALARSRDPRAQAAVIAALRAPMTTSLAIDALPAVVAPDVLDALEQLAHTSQPAPALTALAARDPGRAIAVAGELAGRGEDPRAVVPMLLQIDTPESRAILDRYLVSDDQQTRRIVAEQLATEGADGVPALVTLASDQDQDVRGDAIDSLGAVGTPAAVDALLAAAAPGSPDRRIAVDELVRFTDDDRAVDLLSATIDDEDPDVATIGVESADDLPASAELDERLLVRVRDETASTRLRVSAARALERRGTQLGKDDAEAIDSLPPDDDDDE